MVLVSETHRASSTGEDYCGLVRHCGREIVLDIRIANVLVEVSMVVPNDGATQSYGGATMVPLSLTVELRLHQSCRWSLDSTLDSARLVGGALTPLGLVGGA